MTTKTEETRRSAAWTAARDRVVALLREHSVQLLHDYDVSEEAWRADPEFGAAIQSLADEVIEVVNTQR